MGIEIDEVDAALERDQGPSDVTRYALAAGIEDSAAHVAAWLHSTVFGAEVANTATLYLVAALAAAETPPGRGEAVAWVNEQLSNPFPPSLGELGAHGYIDAAFFAAQERFTWSVAAGVAAVDEPAAELLAGLAPDETGVPTADVDPDIADALMARTGEFVARCSAALTELAAGHDDTGGLPKS